MLPSAAEATGGWAFSLDLRLAALVLSRLPLANLTLPFPPSVHAARAPPWKTGTFSDMRHVAQCSTERRTHSNVLSVFMSERAASRTAVFRLHAHELVVLRG